MNKIITEAGKQFAGLLNSLARENSADHAEEWIVAIEAEICAIIREKVERMLVGPNPPNMERFAWDSAITAVLVLIDRRLDKNE
jgi:hypothetical protein